MRSRCSAPASRMVTALVVAALLLLAGCSAEAGNAPGTGSLPHPGEADSGRPRTGPSHPLKGEWYRYDLYTHCGMRTARFGGRLWELSALRTGVDSEVRGPTVDWGFNYTPGYMRLESARTAVFHTAGQPPVVFRPADDEPPPCA